MSYIGKKNGFGQRFGPAKPSPYLDFLAPLAGKFERSGLSLALVRDDIKKNMSSKSSEPTDLLYQEAKRRTLRAFMLDKPVPMIHLNDVFQEDLPIWSSSPGLPWMQCGYRTKNDIRRDPDAINRIRHFWHRIKCFEKVHLPDCCAYVRTHIVERGETKVRAVWGYPATVTFGEAVFALPLIQAYKKGGYPIAYGFETGNAGCKKMFHGMKGNHYLGIDFTSFDKTLPPWLVSTAFDILAYNIDFLHYRDHGIARVKSMVHMFNVIKDYAINTKIRMCNGERYIKKSGLASGSYFTQLVGSVCNYLLLTYAMLQLNVEINDILVFGDDSILAVNTAVHPDEVQEVLLPLDMTVNVKKSGSSKYISNLTFLGYKICDGIPTRDREKQFAAIVWPERPDKCWDDVASRCFGIMYANFGVDPVVDFWCRRVVNFRPFDLHMTRDQQRFLDLLGLKPTTVPTMHDLSQRIGFLAV
nr:RdRp [Wuhan insect virus 23]